MPAEIGPGHLTVNDVAAYADHGLAAAERARLEEHLAACAECRAEVVAVTRLTRSFAARRRWVAMTPLAAAAAVLVLLVGPWRRPGQHAPPGPILREPGVTATIAPTPIAPRGRVATSPALTWSSVPLADRYQVTLFDQNGSVIWETPAADTTVLIPATVRLMSGVPYYWKVAARIERGRWTASNLTSFTLSRGPPAR